ncbi:hypothetical protein [Kineobactrum salinum]|uniref:Uncharacterized protein n=1 Tax=Kineobactrum salinum TaxID=2708301 RepID=A0A6C0U5V8_9GAMM|nr:hypothetical protein [Kineobactrum salinum]QIB66749.1 hypothetical protein G3T16_16465 [Kineobactrum salinum]
MPAQALATLARDRAAASKRFLVNDAGIAADRAVIEEADPDNGAENVSGVKMAIST